MKIAVLGANGATGKIFVEKALAAGHEVQAGVHSGGLPEQDNLRVMQIDGMNYEQVQQLLEGCDAVVSLVGHGKHTPGFMQTATITNVLNAMDKLGIKRLVSLTGTGARMPGDKPSMTDRLLNAVIARVDPGRIHDGKAHLAVLCESKIDWTVLRVLKLRGGNYTGTVHLSKTGPAELLTSRSKVAQAVLQVLNDTSYKQSAPIIQR